MLNNLERFYNRNYILSFGIQFSYIFLQDCDKLFNGWSEEAYNKVIEKNKILQSLEYKNRILKNQSRLFVESYDKLTKDILRSEYKWDFLLRIQVVTSD